MKKQRLDLLLVARGLAESRTRAQALIMAGLVYHGEQKLDKAGAEFPVDMELTVRGREHPWVSRGGMKLAKAIAHFKLDVTGAVAMDVGASTGGFTDVLLTHGAVKVYAVDVGHGQLDVKLRNDSRVVVMEETNARHLTRQMVEEAEKSSISDAARSASPPAGEATRLHERSECSRSGEGASTLSSLSLAAPSPNPLPQGERAFPASSPEKFLDIIVCDASFISLTKVLPAALSLAKTGAQLVTLIKPQFEVGKVEVSRGKGVIRDSALHRKVCEDISEWVSAQGWQVVGITESPITGPKGNVEFLLVAHKGVGDASPLS
jgi:23S rRNA (cytidine1920-2'-O)/16S rRNA (cytidine1409-2'-O)-methyltransferase